MSRSDQSESVTLKEAYDDIRWAWVTFVSLINAPSILSLLQMIFEHRLIDALQWIVDGYNDIVGQLGAIVEPLVRPFLAWLNARFDWSLELYPHWRPLFLLLAVMASSGIRNAWRFGARAVAITHGLGVIGGALVGALAAGLLPLDGSWWSQGLAAAAPVTAFYAFAGAQQLLTSPNSALRWWHLALLIPVVGGLMFAIGAGVSFVPGLSTGAGILALGLLVLAVGLSNLWGGLFRSDWRQTYLQRDFAGAQRYQIQFGLTAVGGFVAAGLIVAADAIVKMLS